MTNWLDDGIGVFLLTFAPALAVAMVLAWWQERKTH